MGVHSALARVHGSVEAGSTGHLVVLDCEVVTRTLEVRHLCGTDSARQRHAGGERRAPAALQRPGWESAPRSRFPTTAARESRVRFRPALSRRRDAGRRPRARRPGLRAVARCLAAVRGAIVLAL